MPVTDILTELDCVNALRAYVRESGTQQVAAYKLKISQQFLSQMVNQDRKIPPRILRKLGIVRRTIYERVG